MFLWASRPPSDWTPLTCQACWGDMEPAGSLPAFFRGFWSMGDPRVVLGQESSDLRHGHTCHLCPLAPELPAPHAPFLWTKT